LEKFKVIEIKEMNFKFDPFCPIRNKIDVISLILETYSVVLYNQNEKTQMNEKNKKYLSVIQKNIFRFYFYSNNKFFTICMPFKFTSNNKLITLTKNIEIDEVTLSFLKIIFREAKNKGELIKNGLMDFAIEIEDICQQYQNRDTEVWKTLNIEKLHQIIIYLLEYDVGYLRFDIDPENCNINYKTNSIDSEKFLKHPLYHIDTSYSNISGMKIGIDEIFTFSEFERLFQKDENCYFINKNLKLTKIKYNNKNYKVNKI
jgi:hypothetical protein